MHDEATTHFIGMIDQTTLGHLFLKEQLGVVPRTGWQLDPFGHSYTQAKLTHEMGMDALYFGRIDYQDRMLRKNESECEGLWENVFWGLTGSYGGNYGPPEGFMFDAIYDGEPLVTANTTRLRQRISNFMERLSVQASETKGNHVLLTMGVDFTVSRATTGEWLTFGTVQCSSC